MCSSERLLLKRILTKWIHFLLVIGGDFQVRVPSSGRLCVYTCMYVVVGGAVSVSLFYNES